MFDSNNWDANDFSGFFLELWGRSVRIVAPSHREDFAET
jgi:hypothetical protein